MMVGFINNYFIITAADPLLPTTSGGTATPVVHNDGETNNNTKAYRRAHAHKLMGQRHTHAQKRK